MKQFAASPNAASLKKADQGANRIEFRGSAKQNMSIFASYSMPETELDQVSK